MFSSMTGRAVLGGVHFPVVGELLALRFLNIRICTLPAEVGDPVEWTQIRTRIPVTVQTESHAKRLGVIDLVHLVDLTMTVNAAHTPIHVNRVIEVNVVRNFVNLHPRDGLAAQRGVSDNLKPRIFLQNLIVAVHAGRRRRDIGVPTLLYLRVAVATVEAHLIHVDAVWKRHRLDWRIPHPRILRAEVIPDPTYSASAE